MTIRGNLNPDNEGRDPGTSLLSSLRKCNQFSAKVASHILTRQTYWLQNHQISTRSKKHKKIK